MKQEDRKILLADLCARLSYGVKCHINSDDTNTPRKLSRIEVNELDGILLDFCTDREDSLSIQVYLSEVKPYLRPMSSMTEEEKIKLYQKAGFYYLSNNELLKDEWRQFSDALSENELFLPYPIWGNNLQEVYDWLNENHFDYHYSYDIEDGRWKTMIEKGIAIEVTEENNPYEK